MRRLIPLLALLFVVAGCATQPGAPAGWPVGREFWSTSVTENGQDHPLVAGTRIKMSFAAQDPIVVADAGCNAINAYGAIKTDRIIVNDIAETAMGCLAPGVSEQDQWIADFLHSGPAWQLSGDALVLTSGDRVIHLVDRKTVDPDRPLVGTRWTVNGAFDMNTAHTTAAPTPAWIMFGAGGSFTADTGCATLTATYTQSNDAVTLGSVRRVARPCDAAQASVDSDITRALAGQVNVTIAYSTMRLTNMDGFGLDLGAS
jgi:heat shock protein HslJ